MNRKRFAEQIVAATRYFAADDGEPAQTIIEYAVIATDKTMWRLVPNKNHWVRLPDLPEAEKSVNVHRQFLCRSCNMQYDVQQPRRELPIYVCSECSGRCEFVEAYEE